MRTFAARRVIVFILCALVAPGSLAAQEIFDAARRLSDADSIRAAVDLDRDGDLDLVGGLANGLLIVWRNEGDADFVPYPLTGMPQEWTGALAVADFTGDGLDDVLIGLHDWAPNGAGLRVFPQTSAGALGTPFDIPVGAAPLQFSVYDINGDGWQDVLMGLSRSTGGSPLYSHVAWAINGPAGLFIAPLADIRGGAPAIALEHYVVIDWNLDGTPDVVTWDGTTLRTHLSIGAAFGPGPTLTPPVPTGPVLVFPMDLEGDGDMDVLFHRAVNASYYAHDALIDQGGGNFVYSSGLSSGLLVSGQVFGAGIATDWDGDGDDDLLLRTHPSGTTPNHLVLFENVGSGVLTVRQRYPLASSLRGAVGMFDLDGDGRRDFLGAGEFLAGTGRFARELVPGSTVSPPAEAIDRDGDGDPDYRRDGALIVKDNLGDGSTEAGGYRLVATVPPLPGQLRDVRMLDLDGDGDEDLLGRLAGQELRTWLAAADGRLYEAGPTFPGTFVSVSGEDALAADMDRDGFEDLVVGEGLGFGRGDGSYNLLLGPWPGFRVRGVGDVDGDGWPDVQGVRSATMSAPAEIAWWLRSGSSTAYLPIIQSVNALVEDAVVLEDVDADGLPDMVFARGVAGGTQVVVRPSRNGRPGPPVRVTVVGFPANRVQGLVVQDLDGDGRTDLAIYDTDYAANRVAVARGVGPGLGFDPPRLYVMTNTTSFADVDGDGDVDGVGERIHRGLRFDGPDAGTRVQYGTGNAGTGGVAPILGARGPFRVGETAVLRARRFPPFATGFIALGNARAQIPGQFLPGVTGYVQPFLATFDWPFTGGVLGETASGTLDLPFTVPATLAGVTLTVQAAFADPGATPGLVATNGLEIRFGP